MPNVSILIPSYRPDYFEECLESALGQSYGDLEIIVSDDCPTNAIERIVLRRSDARVQYGRNPTPRHYASNRDNLVRNARGRYLKFLFDDDVLYPNSVEMLVRAIDATGLGMAFHHRHVIDASGNLIAAPEVIAPGSMGILPPEYVFQGMIRHQANTIGEPSNVLVDAQTLAGVDYPFEIEGRPSRFLADVAMYYNLARCGHSFAVVGEFGSAFRQHANQNSHQSAPGFAAGIFEWETLARGACAAGKLPMDMYADALRGVHANYRAFQKLHPMFGRFLALEPGLTPETALHAEFFRVLDTAYLEVDARRLGGRAFAQ